MAPDTWLSSQHGDVHCHQAGTCRRAAWRVPSSLSDAAALAPEVGQASSLSPRPLRELL